VILTSSAASSYLWSNGATTQSITVTTSGNYSVAIDNCFNSSPINVTVIPSPPVSISASGPLSFCAGSNVTLTASGGTSYLWSNGETSTSTTITVSGTYSVSATTAAGCSAVSSPISVTVNGAAFQAPSILWQSHIGGSDNDFPSSVIKTQDGGSIVCGTSASSNGAFTGGHGSYDIWLVKYDAAGAVQWTKTYGGSNDDKAHQILQLPGGDFMISARSNSSDGDMNNNHGSLDIWVAHLDSSGNIIWQHNFGSSGVDYLGEMVRTADGGFIVSGYVYKNDGDVTGLHTGGSNVYDFDIWIFKIDSSGSLIWQKCFGGTGEDAVMSIIATPDGNFLIGGGTNSNDGDVSGNHGYFDIWLAKITATGNILWQKSFGGSGDDAISKVRATLDGDFIIAGTSQSNNGDVGGNHGLQDAWVAKTNNTGNLIWQQSIGGTGYEYVNGLLTDFDGGYIIGGTTSSNDGNFTGNHSGYNDVFLAKLSSIGTLQWTKLYGGSNSEYLYDLSNMNSPGYEIAAYTFSGNEGDVNGTALGNVDYWVVALRNIEAITASGPTTFCKGDSVTLTSSPGSSYLWTNGATTQSITTSMTGNYSVSFDQCSLADTVHVHANECNFNVDAKLFIEGYYQGLGTMAAVIDPINLPSLCDTVIMQLAKPKPPYNIMYSDTQVVDVNGNGRFHFITTPEYDRYYVIFRHRNGLETWSAQPIVINSPNSNVCDISTGLSTVYGANEKDLLDGNFAIWSGDVNQDGLIDESDFDLIESTSQQFSFGYLPTDITGDNLIESTDYSLIENNVQLYLFRIRP
jgi:hypothetical protein